MSAAPTGESPRISARGLIGLNRHDAAITQHLASLAIVIISAITTHPRNATAAGIATLTLLVINSALLLGRHLSDSVISSRARLITLWLGVAASSALVALATSGSGYLFAFFIAGNAGFRLKSNAAIAVATACSITSGGILLLHIGPGHRHTPWLVGAMSGLSVLLGMISRARSEMVSSALAAAAAAERAAHAEAREAVLAERGRIARDIHDVLAHSLAGINMQLELADALLESGDLDSVRIATRRAQSLVKASLMESQRSVSALREELLPLPETLTSMLESSGHVDALEVRGTVRELDTRVAQAFLRIAQESLTNATKHAPHAAVGITVTYGPDRVMLEVTNAASADSGNAVGSGMGLVGMRERAMLLGGSVIAGPFDGGWRVEASIPS